MNLFFAFLAFVYGSAIFLMAGSPLVSTLSVFNPFSLLHIPLYGILALLLHLSFSSKKFPFRPFREDRRSSIHKKRFHQEGAMDATFQGYKNFVRAEWNRRERRSAVIAGFLASGIAIADEIHQARVPGRDASVSDVALDLVGILLASFIILWIRKRKISWLAS